MRDPLNVQATVYMREMPLPKPAVPAWQTELRELGFNPVASRHDVTAANVTATDVVVLNGHLASITTKTCRGVNVTFGYIVDGNPGTFTVWSETRMITIRPVARTFLSGTSLHAGIEAMAV